MNSYSNNNNKILKNIKEASLELFKNVAPKYKGNKTSGFTRATAVNLRDWDNAKIVKLELV